MSYMPVQRSLIHHRLIHHRLIHHRLIHHRLIHHRPLLPFVAAQPLVDHHCHGVLRPGRALAPADLAGLLNEADGAAAADGLAFDSLAGLALRRWCPPMLGMAPHAEIDSYAEQRAALGAEEVSRRFLGACGITALCVDSGYTPAGLHSASRTTGPAETGALAGAAAFEIVRLEQVAESLAGDGVSAAGFPDAYRRALSERVAAPEHGVAVAGFKSIAAYRVGLELDGRRPADQEVAAGVGRWLGGAADGEVPRLADEVLHRFFVWCAADIGLPIQFHVGYGDRDIDLHRCNPLLLTGLLRALEPTGAPVMLLHNYPYHREAGYLAQVFPLVYADLGLATHNVGARAAALLAEALELVPLRKFLFSSDAFGLPELYYLGTTLFRQALSSFLSDRLADDDVSEADAERVTRLIGSENACRVYRLSPAAEPGR
jgi:predicted TIM-barrel fold metal-dependent hydrolase